MSEREEKKNQRVGLLTSVGFHFALLALFLFAMGWSAPNPPLSEYGSGVELNFGLDDQGSGDIQTFTPVGEAKVTEAKKEEASPKEEEIHQETQKQEETKAENQLTQQDDSPVEVKEIKKETKKTETVKESSQEDKRKQVETKKEDGKATNNSGTDIKKPADDTGKSASDGHSQGDDKNKKGDKGSPEGSLDPNGQYTGKPGTGGNGGGGGNGFGLQMAGWNWDSPPQAPRLPDNENGRIVFEIVVDENGEIMKIETLERGLSPEAEKLCKEEIQKRSLVRTSGGAAPEQSKGKITFILRTR